MAGINEAIAAINAIFDSIPEIGRVYSEAPDVASSELGELPCVIPIFQSLAHKAQAFDYQRKDYTIKYLVLVAPYSKTLIELERDARPLVDKIADRFFQNVRLNDTANIDHATLDTINYTSIEYNPASGVTYIGLECMFSVTIKQVINQTV